MDGWIDRWMDGLSQSNCLVLMFMRKKKRNKTDSDKAGCGLLDEEITRNDEKEQERPSPAGKPSATPELSLAAHVNPVDPCQSSIHGRSTLIHSTVYCNPGSVVVRAWGCPDARAAIGHDGCCMWGCRQQLERFWGAAACLLGVRDAHVTRRAPGLTT